MPRSRLWLLVIPALLVAVVLGARGLDIAPMWGDEYRSIRDAGGYGSGLVSPAQVAHWLATNNPWHVPGYFLLLNGWAQLVGWETFALRWLSLLVGLLGVAWTYRLGADWLTPRAGVFAAAIIATSAVFTDQTQDVRMHVFNYLFVPLCLWLYLRIMHRAAPPRRWEWVALALVVVAMAYTHYFVALPLLALAAYHLLLAPKNRRWWGIVGVGALAALAFAPWVTVLLSGIGLVTESERMQSLALRPVELTASIAYLFSNGVPLLLVAAVALALTARGRRAGRVLFLAAALLAIMAAANLVIGSILPHRMRYTTSLWVPLALVVALGITQLHRWRIVMSGALGVWLAVALLNGASLNFAREQDDNVAEDYFRIGLVDRTLRQQNAGRDDALVMVVPDSFNLDNTLTSVGWYQEYRRPLRILQRVTGAYPDDATEQREWGFVLEDIGEQRSRVWLASMPDHLTRALFEFQVLLMQNSFAVCEQPDAGRALRLELYARSPVCCHPERAAPTHRYGDGIAILGVDIHPQEGDTLPVGVMWSIDPDVPPDIYSVTLQLWDENRNPVAQLDAGLDDLRYLCQRASIPVSDVPAGDYSLWAAVYDWQTGERLPGQDLTNGGVSDMLHITDVTLE